jgi:hypothetical protein
MEKLGVDSAATVASGTRRDVLAHDGMQLMPKTDTRESERERERERCNRC